jgi:hypothetical protein
MHAGFCQLMLTSLTLIAKLASQAVNQISKQLTRLAICLHHWVHVNEGWRFFLLHQLPDYSTVIEWLTVNNYHNNNAQLPGNFIYM